MRQREKRVKLKWADKGFTVKGRTQKPLLIARPVRDNPKSTPKLNPPHQSGSCFLRRAFGGISPCNGIVALTLARLIFPLQELEEFLGTCRDDDEEEEE